MTGSPPNPEPTCWSCEAPNDAGSSECWLCQRRDWNRHDGQRRRSAPAPPRHGPLSTIGGLMVGIALMGVVMALFVLAPPLAFVLSASAVPALFITESKAYRRRRRGVVVSGWQRLRWFLGFTVLIPIVVVALVVCVVVSCVTLVSLTR